MSLWKTLFPRKIGTPTPAAPRPPKVTPVNTVPSNASILKNASYVYSASNGNPIRVADSDSRIVTVVLTVNNGILTLGNRTGVTAVGNGTNQIKVSGSPANINNALNGLRFTSSIDFVGTATITMVTSDGTTYDSDTFDVEVTAGGAPTPAPAGPAPTNSVPGPQSVDSGVGLIFSSNNGNAVTVSDTDTPSITSKLTTTTGTLTALTGTGATVTGNGTQTVSITGSPTQINNSLNGLRFASAPTFSGAASITIETTDGTTTDTDSITITVGTPAPQPPAPPPGPVYGYAFGSRKDLVSGKYVKGVVVSNRATTTMDTDLRNKYNQWKAALVVNVPTVSGGKAVKFSDAAITVSEGMGYGMILACIFEDQATFNALFKTVRARPAYSLSASNAGANQYLMDWKLGPNGESGDAYGGGWNAMDGDLDIAYALLMANRQWTSTGQAYNYLNEAKLTIAALKAQNFSADGTTRGLGSSDISRTSDYMFGHFRAFGTAMNDPFWVGTVIPRCIEILTRCQTVFSAANNGPGALVPDFIENANGNLAGQNYQSPFVTNIHNAFGVPLVYGSGNMSFVPCKGGRADYVPTEMHYYANALRCPLRWGMDLIVSGDQDLKVISNKLVNWVKGFEANNPATVDIGYRLNGGLSGAQGGPIGMGNAWPARPNVGGFMVAGCADGAHQNWVNDCYTYCLNNWVTLYYDCELLLLSMVVASGNWWHPDGTGGGGTVTNSSAPTNTVPGPQTVTTNVDKVFSLATQNQIAVADANSPSLTTTVSVTNGTVTAVAAAGGSGALLADGWPARILGCYYEAYNSWNQSNPRITAVPLSFNVIYLFQLEFNADGSAKFPWTSSSEMRAADIQECRRRGQRVILTAGGAGKHFYFNTRTQSQAFVNSAKAIITTLGGVDGIDWNNFEGPVVAGMTQAQRDVFFGELIWITQQLKAAYPSIPWFACTAPPAPNDPGQQQLCVALKNAGVLTWAAPQYYDWSGFKAVGFISGLSGGTNRNLTWVNLLGASKVCLGLSANYNFTNSLTLAECTREWDKVIADHPNQRGMFCWSAMTNLASGAEGNNLWGSTMRARLDSLGSSSGGATITGNGTSSVKITGTPSQVNAALDGMKYRASLDYMGQAAMTIHTTDGTFSDTDTITLDVSGFTSNPAPAPEPGAPPPPPAPAPSSGEDVLNTYFSGGNQGAWLRPQPISAFHETHNGGVALTAYGTEGGTSGLFGRWKGRSIAPAGKDFIETDQFSRPYARTEGGFPYATIYENGSVLNAGGSTSKFYACIVVMTSTYYGTWLSDQGTDPNKGIRLAHDADQSGPVGTGDIIFVVGTGTAQVKASTKIITATNYTHLGTSKNVIEVWHDGAQMGVRANKGNTVAKACPAIAQGIADMIVGAINSGGGDPMHSRYYGIAILKNACPTQSERDLIASWMGAEAGLTI